jgi:hypothetical protein
MSSELATKFTLQIKKRDERIAVVEGELQKKDAQIAELSKLVARQSRELACLKGMHILRGMTVMYESE